MFIFWVCVVLASVSPSLAGWIQSPGFPRGYSPDLNEFWRRCAPPGHVLSLTLIHLDLEESNECENDALKISEDGHFLANLCGKKTFEELQSSVNPSLRSSSGGCLSINFYSDYSNTERHAGFKAFYTTQDVDECWENSEVECSHFCHNYIGGYSCSCSPGYYLDPDEHTCRANCTENRYGAGVLTPPGSPGPYYENADCLYSLSVGEGDQIELKFTGVFDVERINGVCVDFVKVKTDTETFGPFCGKDRPADIHTAAQHVQVIFHSDQGGTNQGFSLQYRPKVMECSGKVTPHSTVSPVKQRYPVGEKVTVRCEQGYAIAYRNYSFESTCLFNGKWSDIHNCEMVNCGPPDISDLMAFTENTGMMYHDKFSINCSTHYYHLVGNANFLCNETGDWMTENGQNFSQITTKCVPVCGITKSSAGGRIFGGKTAKLGEIPWQLLVKEPQRGGASLINDRWAITAAHVVEKQRSLKFFGGMVDGLDKNKVELGTETIIIHPGYDYTKSHYDNDIALVKMSSRVPLSENIMPVCLPERKSSGLVLEGKQGTVSGLGATSDRREKSRYLQYGHVKEYSGPCFNSNLKVTKNMFCAGDADGGVDSCKGDSGGPLVIPMLGFGSSDTPYRLKGIVSWGPPVCGDKNYKGYYTKVENYLDWIRETMEKN